MIITHSKEYTTIPITLRTLNDGNYGIFLVMGDAGFISSTVFSRSKARFESGLLVKGSGIRVEGLGVKGLGFRD